MNHLPIFYDEGVVKTLNPDNNLKSTEIQD